MGSFHGTADFDPEGTVDEHSSIGGEYAFLSRFSEAGAFQWARSWGGIGDDRATGVAAGIGSNKSAYVAGFFAEAVDFNPGPGNDPHVAENGRCAFLTRYLENGYWE